MHFLIIFFKNYFLIASINLTTQGPLYTCLVQYRNIQEQFAQNLVVLVPSFLFFNLRSPKILVKRYRIIVFIKLGDFISKNARILDYLTKSGKFGLFFSKMRFSQNHVGTDLIFKNEARKLLVVPLYGICSVFLPPFKRGVPKF